MSPSATAATASSRRSPLPHVDVFDLLGANEPPAFATDQRGRVVFWNPGAQELFHRSGRDVLGKACCSIIDGRDPFGNRFCRADCPVMAMARRGESIHGFEMDIPEGDQRVHVTVLEAPVPGGGFTLIHLLRPSDHRSELARSLERLRAHPVSGGTVERRAMPRFTPREWQVLGLVARGFPNRRIARELGLSVATVRNHVRSVLEKSGARSKLEMISIAFRHGWLASRERGRA